MFPRLDRLWGQRGIRRINPVRVLPGWQGLIAETNSVHSKWAPGAWNDDGQRETFFLLGEGKNSDTTNFETQEYSFLLSSGESVLVGAVRGFLSC